MAEQLAHQRIVHPGPLVLGTTFFKFLTCATDRDRTVSRRSEPSSRSSLIGEQPNPWDLLQPQDEKSRHRGAKHPRRYGLLGGISQFLHGEQGALLVASQLVSCAPTYQAKLYAASQCFDEARHVEVFNRYLQDVMGMSYPISPSLKALLDKGLTDPRWDLKFIAMQIIIEGLALAAFQSTKMSTSCPLLRDLTHYVIRDEARHVTFGINYLEDFNKTLSEDEIEDRARFAYEACVIMRDRIQNYELGKKFFGYSEQEAREAILKSGVNDDFRGLLFNRVMPNLKKIGLLTESVRPLYDELGLLEYEVAPSDFEIDWAEISKPLESSDEIETQAEEQAEVIKEMFHNH